MSKYSFKNKNKNDGIFAGAEWPYDANLVANGVIVGCPDGKYRIAPGKEQALRAYQRSDYFTGVTKATVKSQAVASRRK